MSAPVIEQQAAPPPATTKWVPVGPGMAGIPTPVVNGQWVKGVGGAAVWSPITPADVLPASVNGQYLKSGAAGAVAWSQLVQADLGTNGPISKLSTVWDHNDLNAITDSGWYNGSALVNAPGGRGDWLFVLHISHQNGPSYATQICWTMQQNPVITWTRSNIGNNWMPWSGWGGGDAGWSLVNNFSGYAAGIGDYGPPYGPGKIRKLASGLVVCQGLITVPSLAAGGGAFTFPAGWRPDPAQDLIFLTANSGGVVTETWRINQGGAGVMTCSTGPIGWVTLNGVQFYADG